MINRRTFLAYTAAGALILSVRANSQQSGKLPRVALVFGSVPIANMAGAEPTSPLARAFVHGLRDLGWIDGANVIVERRSGEGREERIPILMRELVASRVDVIVTSFPLEASRATGSIPIVALADNPVYERLVVNLARPERNITGVGSEADPAINGKRMQLLKDLAPKASRLVILGNNPSPGKPTFRPETEAAARVLGITLISVEAKTVEQLQTALAALARDRPDAMLVSDFAVNYAHPGLITDFAAKHRIPAMYFRREFVDAGGLISYGSNFTDELQRAAGLVDKILRGARPADLPFQLPTKLELVVNLKAAKALGLTIPQSLLLRADEVIQ